MPPSKTRSLRELAFSIARRNSSPSPPSPTFTDATNASAMDFGPGGPEKIITRSNLKTSIQALEDLVKACANYRTALTTMSKATAVLADAMERCGGLKGPSYEASTRLQAASGIHHLIGNQWHVLAETLDRNFEKPMRQHLETYRTIVMERSATYERALREKSQIIRDTEARNMNRKERNLQTFREALAILQRQVDELDELKAAHYQEIIEHEEEVWDVVQGKICIAVRSTMEVFDRFTAKASDPIIEPMLQSVPDPFDSYGPPQSADQIFSILAPLSIMTNAQLSTTSSPMTVTPERLSTEQLSPSGSKIASWLPITGSSVASPTESSEWVPTVSQSQSTLSRRHSDALSSPPRKAESNLRFILSSIDELRPHPDLTPISDTPSLPATNGRIERIEHSTHHDWAFSPTHPPKHPQYEGDVNDTDDNPQHTYLFASPAAQSALNSDHVTSDVHQVDVP
ncbi:hypothetical protein APHAL10511_002158 [Amanita phalloides]|nr:hypothetical protein APHAL10511_002158 [Amanita phalloides]